MGFWSLMKANFRSIRVQRKIEEAMAAEDMAMVTELISQSVATILRAGLTRQQLQILEAFKDTHREELNELFTRAFQRGWMRNGVPNLSNAMDEVLRAAQDIIKEARRLRRE